MHGRHWQNKNEHETIVTTSSSQRKSIAACASIAILYPAYVSMRFEIHLPQGLLQFGGQKDYQMQYSITNFYFLVKISY